MHTRRRFLASSSGLLVGKGLAAATEPIVDIHQHLNYKGRSDEEFLAHQRAMGVTTTVLLPAGRPVTRPSTHDGGSNGLAAQVSEPEQAMRLARKHRRELVFGSNDVPDLAGAASIIERYLKQGARVIGELKFGVECDGPEMQAIYRLAQSYRVPVLIHFQVGKYNHGYDRFHEILRKYTRVTFIGHAQTVWANIDRNNKDDPRDLYPKGPVTAGGLTDRYLADYPNLYADMSAGSGLNALTRDEEHARGFIARHQNKLLFGSDCDDKVGQEPACTGARTLAAIRRLSASKAVERKLLYENARKVFRL